VLSAEVECRRDAVRFDVGDSRSIREAVERLCRQARCNRRDQLVRMSDLSAGSADRSLFCRSGRTIKSDEHSYAFAVRRTLLCVQPGSRTGERGNDPTNARNEARSRE
jgi:hypothetical protein